MIFALGLCLFLIAFGFFLPLVAIPLAVGLAIAVVAVVAAAILHKLWRGAAGA